MIVESRRIEYRSCNDTFTLLPIGDIHLGNKTCDKRKLKQDLKEVTDKHIIVGLGDWLDSILVKDAKRYRKAHDDSETEAIIDDQIEEAAEIFGPYAKQIIGIGDGNHEEKIIDLCGTNPIKRLCEKLSTQEHQIPYLGYSWLYRLLFYQKGNAQTRCLIIRGHHGWGGGSRTEGADITKYSKDVLFWQADLFLYGHVHKLKSNDVEEGRIIGEHSWKTFQKKMLICGTYQRTYSNTTTATYAERMGFPPTTIRSPKVFLRPWRRGVEITVQH